jgi:beta-galactosidase
MRAAFTRDLMRSLARGRPWMLMEQATSHVQWRPTNVRKPTGQMQAMSLQAVARGADGINFFQWRQSRSGAEKFHSAMVPHSGTRSRVWRSVVALGDQLRRLENVAGERITGEVAVVLDWDSWWGLEGEAQPQQIDYIANLEDWYEALYDLNLTIDVVSTAHNLSSYAVVLAPHLYLLPKAAARRLADYVDGGGTLLLTFASGIVDQHDHAHLGGYLGGLRETAGLTIDEFAPLPLIADADGYGATVAVRGDLLGEFSGTIWAEFLQLISAETIARFRGGDLDGEPAITRNRAGKGRCWYVATHPERSAIRLIASVILAEAGVATPQADLPAGVEAQVRGNLLFLINHRSTQVVVDRSGHDVLTGQSQNPVKLTGYGVAALEIPDRRNV